MQLSLNTKIASNKTVQNWNDAKVLLTDYNQIDEWENAFNAYFIGRLNARYFEPIASIEKLVTKRGKGFSVMTIACSIIEFLETTYMGLSFNYAIKGIKGYQYGHGVSKKLFDIFLTTRLPFAKTFDKSLAEDFYSQVRCGLLHEARTNGNWVIRTSSTAKQCVEIRPSETILYYNLFLLDLEKYIQLYKTELLGSHDRKDAFIRKFDSLCNK